MCGLQFVQKASDLTDKIARLEYEQWTLLDYSQLAEDEKEICRNRAVEVITVVMEEL